MFERSNASRSSLRIAPVARARSILALATATIAFAAVGGCATAPAEGAKVSGPGASFTVSGFSTQSGRPITVQTVAPNGTVTTVGTAVSATNAASMWGTPYYPWSVTIAPSAATWARGSYTDVLTIQAFDGTYNVNPLYDDWFNSLSLAPDGSSFVSTYSKPESDLIHIYSSRTPQTTAYAECGNGSGSCPACVRNLESTMANTSNMTKADARISWSSLLPPYSQGITQNVPSVDGAADHIQGVQSIPSWEQLTGHRWVVIDWQNENWERISGIPDLQQPRASADTAPFNRGLVFAEEATPGSFVARYYYRLPDAPHPGGMQVSGNFLVVGSDWNGAIDSPAWVDIFDLSSFSAYRDEVCPATDVVAYGFSGWMTDHMTYPTIHGRPCGPARFVQRKFLDGTQGEPGQTTVKSRAALAGMTRLLNGHYLMFVQDRKSVGGWFYRSDQTKLDANTTWSYVAYKQGAPQDQFFTDAEFGSINFVHDCATQRVYAVALGVEPTSIGFYQDGVVLLYAFNQSTPDTWALNMQATSVPIIRIPSEVGACTLRAGAGFETRADGSVRILCTSRGDGNSVALRTYTIPAR